MCLKWEQEVNLSGDRTLYGGVDWGGSRTSDHRRFRCLSSPTPDSPNPLTQAKATALVVGSTSRLGSQSFISEPTVFLFNSGCHCVDVTTLPLVCLHPTLDHLDWRDRSTKMSATIPDTRVLAVASHVNIHLTASMPQRIMSLTLDAGCLRVSE